MFCSWRRHHSLHCCSSSANWWNLFVSKSEHTDANTKKNYKFLSKNKFDAAVNQLLQHECGASIILSNRNKECFLFSCNTVVAPLIFSGVFFSSSFFLLSLSLSFSLFWKIRRQKAFKVLFIWKKKIRKTSLKSNHRQAEIIGHAFDSNLSHLLLQCGKCIKNISTIDCFADFFFSLRSFTVRLLIVVAVSWWEKSKLP